MTNTEIREFIGNAIAENPVMLFMKGSPEQPACGFSARTAACLNALGVRYAALDILPDPRIREELSGLSNWPTIPQLFVKGELVGGADIVTEMYESGELAELLEADQPEDSEQAAAQSEAPVANGSGPLPLENRLD
jgi:monothiol glutaredoxin